MTIDEPIGIAVVGSGLIAEKAHVPAWSVTPGAEVLWAIDSDVERARSMAEKWGVPRWGTSLQDALEDADVSAVDICLPPHLHLPSVREVVNAGRHVIFEKPICLTMDEASELVKLQELGGRTVMVAENWLFATPVRVVRDLIDRNALGDIFMLRSHHESDQHLPSGRQPEWTYQVKLSGGGYLMQAGVHAVAMSRLLMGNIVSVFAVSTAKSKSPVPVLDRDLVLSMEFESGGVGSISLTAGSHHVGPRRLHQSVFGSSGVAEFDILSGRVAWTTDGVMKEHSGPSSMGFAEELGHFVECVRTGAEPLTSPRRQISALAVVMAGYQSLYEHRPVSPTECGGTVGR